MVGERCIRLDGDFPAISLQAWSADHRRGRVHYYSTVATEGEYDYLLQPGRDLRAGPSSSARSPMRPIYHLAAPGDDRTLCRNTRAAFVSVQAYEFGQRALCLSSVGAVPSRRQRTFATFGRIHAA